MHPILFSVPTPWGFVPIYAYGVLLGLSLLLGLQLVLHIGKRKRALSEALLGNATLVSVVSGLLGARLLYVFENREALAESGARWFDLSSGGVTAYGGFLGGLLGAALYLRFKHASLLAFADATAPALAAGTAITRIGCYLYGSDFGTRLPETAPHWLVQLGSFPRWHHEALSLYGSPAFLYHVDRYALAADAEVSLPVHPTQLYESLFGFVLFGFVMWLLPRCRFSGQLILVTAMAYGSFRFFIEYLRDDPERGQAFGYSSAQLISLLLVPICAVIYSALRSDHRRA